LANTVILDYINEIEKHVTAHILDKLDEHLMQHSVNLFHM